MKTLRVAGLCLDLNLGASEYEAGVLMTQPQCSVVMESSQRFLLPHVSIASVNVVCCHIEMS
jgi:hypothetical protein